MMRLRESSGISNPPLVPNYIVLDSNEEVFELRHSFNFTEQNIIELLTQVFDGFMNFGLCELQNAKPVLGLLVLKFPLEYKDAVELDGIFLRLCRTFYQHLISLNFTEVMRNDHNSFNYCFHSLRNNSIVLRHLSSLEGVY